MDLGSILVILALAIVAVGFIARPLFEQNGFIDTYQGTGLSKLLAERERILTILQELDMDFTMGKIAENDYVDQRSMLVTRGATVLKNIDMQRAAKPDASEVLVDKEQLDLQIEAAIAQKRKPKAEATNNFCGQCGNGLYEGDHFCSVCGTPVPTLETEA